MNATTSKPQLAPTTASKDQLDGTLDFPTPSIRLSTVWTILRLTFGLVPIVAGVDKFTNVLVTWDSYLNPLILNLVPLDGHVFMGIVGVIEIVAGILVLARPRLGGFVVMTWLTCIALSLITSGKYFDVAVRDLVMAIGAFSLAKLTPLAERARVAEPHR
jgi:uncharacterized membrane protein YphA (DoxX/SURF4 family)